MNLRVVCSERTSVELLFDSIPHSLRKITALEVAVSSAALNFVNEESVRECVEVSKQTPCLGR